MNRNSAGPTNDQRRSASQSLTKQQLSGILNYDFIDPGEDYPSARAKENSFTQHPAPGYTSMYTSFPVEDERSSIKFNGTGKFSPTRTLDQSMSSKSKGPAPPNIDYKSNSAVRTKSYSPINSHKKATRRSPQHSRGTAEMSQSVYESSGQKKMNMPSSSVNVMRRVFDEDYSLSSPNKRIINESQDVIGDIDASWRMEERSRDHMTSIQMSRPKGPEVNFEFLDRSYQILLAKIKANPKMSEASMDDYIKESVEYLTNSDMMLRTGALINLFDILYYNAHAIIPEYVIMICTQIFNLLPHYYTTDDFYFSYISMEILHLLGPNDVVYNNIKFLLALLTDEKFPRVQERTFKVLANLDYPGLYALFDLASKDFDDVPFYVLNQLAQVPEIQARIIVPALLNDLGTTDNKKRIASLAALNRTLGMVKMGGGLPMLISLLQEGSLDRQLVASTILGAGPVGESTLLKILKTTNNTKIKQAICSAMSWRVPDPNKIKLKIEVIPYQVSQHYNLNPGTMCVYSGDLRPLFIAETAEKDSNAPQEDKIEINSRDFLAALNRYISLKYQDFALRDTDSYPKDQEDFKNFNDFNTYILERFLKNESQEAEQTLKEQLQISPNIIKALIAQYNDRDKLVRESVVNTLGLIGYPEAVEALDMLVKALYDGEAQIRAVAAWAIGKLGDVGATKASRRLVELLKDNFWKVRTSACIALGCMGDSADTSLFAILVKALKDGSINKVVVCETLVRLGERGEFIILDILKKVPNVNYVLKAALIQSLELAEVNRPTIDFVIEELFRNAADSMVQVRRACLVTLEKLRLKAHNNNITYLKSKNILPLFYYFLQDASNEIRSMALQSIYSFGPQGELMLIEGLAKDKNSTIRAECAKGLGLYGPHTFRALIFGLRDPEENVRTATASALKKNFTPDEVINHFREKHHQTPAIICSIREIMNLNYYYQKATKEYLETILNHFQNEMNHNKSTLETRMTSSFAKDRPETFYTQEHEDRPLQYGYSPSQASQQKDLSMSKPNGKDDSYLDQFRVEHL